MSNPPPDDPRTDLELVDALNDGDASAFDALYFRHRDWVLSLAYRFCRNRDEAQDVAQDAFMYLLGKFPGFELRAQLTTFLYPAVKHCAIRRRDKSRRYGGGSEADEITLSTAVDAGVDDPATAAIDVRDELTTVMAGLTEAHREVMLMRCVDGMSLQDIAEALDTPLGTIKSRLHHALNALRDDDRTKKYFER